MKARRLSVVLGALFALVGCTLTQSSLRNPPMLPGGLGRTGQVIIPKQCRLEMIIPSRPLGDPALNEAIWDVADAQVVEDDTRRALEGNGLRVGVISGKLPEAVRDVLEAPPPNRVDPAIVYLPDGDNTLVDFGPAQEELTLLVNRDGSTGGKRYKDAKGHLRISARRDAENGVVLRIVPEVHHGPVRPSWSTAPGGGAYAPQQLVPHNGQAEESYRELAAEIRLLPGQVAAIGAVPERRGSLGHFLFTTREANSDRLKQMVLLVRASSTDAKPDEGPVLPSGLQPYEPEIVPGSLAAGDRRDAKAKP